MDVRERGAGPAILLVHAGGSTGAVWDPVAERLAGAFRVLVYDRPTYRTPTPLRGAEAMAAEVADLRGVADAVDEPLLVVGHSSGGVVALEAELQQRFAGLLLYEPPVAGERPIGGEALRRARAAGPRRPARGDGDPRRRHRRRGPVRRPRVPGCCCSAASAAPPTCGAKLDALAAVLPLADPVEILAGHGHVATVRAPDRVAAAIAGFAGRVL